MKRKDFITRLGLVAGFAICPKLFYASVKKVKTNYQKCKEEWRKLCGVNADKEPFTYVNNEEGIPNVLLYGDSISIGYTPTVRSELKGKANVYRIHRNGASSNQFIKYIEEMKNSMFQPYLNEGWSFNWDVIHFNVGLHDLKYLAEGNLDKENGKQMTSIANYKGNLKAICKYLMSEYPEAVLVFATTTPVPEGEPGRFMGDELKYNKAAMEILSQFPQIKINDLHEFVRPNFEDWKIKPGNVHYNVKGKQQQGKEVARTIIKYL
ncbi:SGNH/GDSL hydrolase family protein [Puteibacter caeruleilacunae]|nr:SGNH/GDSL hydrolase family protein [Puteibacter caeruleilacunae]